jgi:hypothetical protein
MSPEGTGQIATPVSYSCGPSRDVSVAGGFDVLVDLWTAFQRVIGRSRPETTTAFTFVGDELLGNTVGWTAGLSSAWLVDYFFVRKGLRNLWGLAPSDRMVVSGDQYEWLGMGASYLVGLATLILVRHFVVGTFTELSTLRAERDKQLSEVENRESA